MKSVLILGGTGAMGMSLVPLLEKTYDVTVTSRSFHKSDDVLYIKGNPHDTVFLKQLLSRRHFDAIVDFMNYKADEFNQIADILLSHTQQYIFTSSARVYNLVDGKITEDSPRLLDTCADCDYLKTNEYALEKAREENYILKHQEKNWTIIRPGLIYNDNRFQLALWEKEEWLYRALNGKKIVMPKELENVRTTMTYGRDAAYAISKLVCNISSLGEVFNITGDYSLTWGEILKIYIDSLREYGGIDADVYWVSDVDRLSKMFNRYYQIKYARGVSREFNNSKLINAIGEFKFLHPQDGLRCCIDRFISNGANFASIPWIKEAAFDRITGEHANLKQFDGIKGKIGYIVARNSKYVYNHLNNR